MIFNQQTIQKMVLLGLKGMISAYEAQQQQPEAKKLSFDQRFGMLIDAEVVSRNNKRIERLLKGAKFRYPDACIEDVIFKNQRNISRDYFIEFSNCTWIENKQAILITGATGVGKSWLACALGDQACRNQLSTVYLSSTSLLEQMRTALVQGTMNKLRRTLTQTKLLIIDDFGISPIDPELGASILEIIDKQSVNGGLLITSQIPPEQWYDLFNNPTIADAVLDRIIHRANRIELKGESMRKKIKQK